VRANRIRARHHLSPGLKPSYFYTFLVEPWVAETRVTFDRPSLRGRKRGARPTKGKPIDVRVVVAELRGVDTSEHYEWVLLTNLEDSIEQVVAIYRKRWRIERFFDFIKVGLRLERWRQRSGEAIARRLALTMLAAMALYQLKANGDQATLKTVATMGGWLGRKGDAMGPVVLMRGMLVLLASLDARSVGGGERNACVHARSIEDDARSIEDDARSIEDDARSIEDDARSIEDDARSIEDDARSIEDDARSIEDDARSIEDDARSIGAAPEGSLSP
jgi:hypothetical protein